jgi:hypothetical protein
VLGVGGAVSPLLAKEILHGDATIAGLAFAALTFGAHSPPCGCHV